MNEFYDVYLENPFVNQKTLFFFKLVSLYSPDCPKTHYARPSGF